MRGSQCLDPKNQDGLIEPALRLASAPFMFARRQSFPICERCGLHASTEVDHVSPKFKEIVRLAMQCMTATEIHTAIQRFDWWSEAPFTLPAENSALAYVSPRKRNAASCVQEQLSEECSGP